MSLLADTRDGYDFSYQMPLDFEKQLEIIQKMQMFYDYKEIEGKTMSFPRISDIWAFIKNNIDIRKEGKAIFISGVQKDKEANMLKLSCMASKFFIDKFSVFMAEASL